MHAAAPPGTTRLVGGSTAIFADINTANNRDLSVILPVAGLLIALILALLLRSLVAPIYLVIAVLLNFAATLGATVFVFQGLRGEPGVTFQLPIILYLFVVAIGTDYNILMIARLREEAREGNAAAGGGRPRRGARRPDGGRGRADPGRHLRVLMLAGSRSCRRWASRSRSASCCRRS